MAILNPFAFRPLQVTFWTTAIYLAIVVPLVFVQESVPKAPSESALPAGVSLVEAWADLGNVTHYYHPANSHANDGVRAFLLDRIGQILDRNGASWTTQADRVAASGLDDISSPAHLVGAAAADTDAVVFDDMLANVSFSTAYTRGRRSGLHFQGTNIYVYIRGTRDPPGAWWQASEDAPEAVAMKKQLVLVNAHFDSVPSGFGATDDGVGVVSGLQTISHFSTAGHRPQRGIVVLLNNAEEEFLLGATAFANSPLQPFVGTFVNLEGAGAGGRAVLFRSTDLQVMTAYRQAPAPSGSVVANDGFKLNMIRSETDYRVWVNALGYRGLDIAFMKPRVRYHTQQDDRRHTSKDSVWHMLSAALASARSLSGAAGDQVSKGQTDAVWFDMFGDSLVLFALRGLFAWSVTILVVSPLIIALIVFLLYRLDKDYLFRAAIVQPDRAPEASRVPIGGWKGFFRFPLAFVLSIMIAAGAGLLLCKVQPFIIYSSLYAVLTLMATLFYFVFWFIMRSADFARPSAFHRTYSLFWLFVVSWTLLVAVTSLEDQSHIASGYIIVFWASSIFVALVISLAESFSLKTKAAYVEELDLRRNDADANGESEALIAADPDEEAAGDIGPSNGNGSDANHEDPTESSPLLGRGAASSSSRMTFVTGYRRSLSALLEQRRREASEEEEKGPHAFGYEQEWSSNLPSWTWFPQFLVLGPVNMIITGQLLLSLTVALQQTGTDGSNLLTPYLLIILFTVLFLSPLTPFIHRVTRHIPLLFGAAFVATLIYCLSAFPFSPTSPFKFSIRQTFSVDYGNTSVIVTGYQGYIDKVIASIPSARGRDVTCVDSFGRQTGLLDCSFDGTGLEPSVEGTDKPYAGTYEGLISINASRVDAQKAAIEVNAANTKSCALHFDTPVRSVAVRGGLGMDSRIDFDSTPPREDGNWEISEFTLWRRDWATPWVVDVELAADEDGALERVLEGAVICRWADTNSPDALPAMDEAWKYAPAWSIVTIRANPSPVQGSKKFSV